MEAAPCLDLEIIHAKEGESPAFRALLPRVVEHFGEHFLWNDRISSVKVTPGYEFTMFNDANFTGSALSCGCDVPNLPQYNFNDLASSVRVIRK